MSIYKKVGCLYGSFNPITNAHIEVANQALDIVDEVWFIISPHNPFKDINGLASPQDRFRMVELSCKGNDKLKPCDIEFDMPLPSKTISTLDLLNSKHKDIEFYFIAGTEVINSLPLWEEWERILSENKFIVFIRDNKNLNDAIYQKINAAAFIKSSSIISATAVRNLIIQSKSIDGLVCSDVKNFIEIKNLYGNS